jgi:4-hydroxy-3-methylbut-2-enyl diphosphate reductase
MKVLLINPRGFCAGVSTALRCLDLTLRRLGAPVYAYHEIVHNQRVVEDFQSRGAIFVDSIEDVPFESVVVFSAHGVAPSVRASARERRLQTIDATCPLVAKVHAEAIRFARQGYTIILVGHAGHDEVQGVIGEAPDSILLVETLADVERLSLPRNAKLAWITQTTLSVGETSLIVERLEKRFPQIVGPAKEDICYASF